MNRKTGLILLIVALGFSGYGASYYLATHHNREMLCGDPIGLVWLKTEYHLSDLQFEKVRALHEAYLPRCTELCSEIRESNLQLQQAVNSSPSLSPEVAAAVERYDKARSACRKAMLEHIYAVSHEMEPAEGRRFVETVSKRVFSLETAAPMPACAHGCK